MARLQLFLLSLFLSFASTRSTLVNITVDDTFGDPTTGSLPEYLPNEETWNLNLSSQTCPSCGIDLSALDLTQIYKETWHDTMYLSVVAPATITVRFNGSALYVFNVLGKVVPGAAMSNISFSIDGENVGRFVRSPESSTDIVYNQLVYHNTTLEDGPHTLVMTPADLTLMMFDYLLYTTQSDGTTPASTSSSTPPPSYISSSTEVTSTSNPDGPFHSSSAHTPAAVEGIVGGVLGGICLLGLAVAVFLLRRRHKRRRSAPMRARRVRAVDHENSHSRPRERSTKEGRGQGGPRAQPRPMVSRNIAISPPRPIDGVIAHNNSASLTSDVQLRGQDSAPNASLRATVGGGSPDSETPGLAVPVDRSSNSKHRAELAQRLETLQRTRSVLSSQAPSGSESGHSPYASAVSRELAIEAQGGTEAAICMRELECEIARLRGILAAMNVNVPFVDGHGHDTDEPLPAYAE